MNLSSYHLIHILKFLTIEEIFNLQLVSKKFIFLLNNEQMQIMLLSHYYPIKVFQQISPKHYLTSLKSLIDYKTREIPFWGYETNGGLADNSLRFWIGKSFMQTKKPQVALRRVENIFISGTLAFDQVGFRNALKDFAYKIYLIFGEHLTEFFYHSNNEINKKQDINVQNICIFDVFRSFQILYYNLDEDDLNVNNDFQCIKYLQKYAQTKTQEIYQMLDTDNYFLKEQSHKIIPNTIAIVQGITINRKTEFERIIKTILIYTSQQQYINYEPNFTQNYTTVQQLLTVIQEKYDQFKPCKTNIPQLQHFQNVEFDQQWQNQYLYCTFYPQGEREPLLWLQFVNQELEEIHINFNSQTQRFAKSVSLRIMDVIHQADADFDDGGASFAFVSLKGQLYNQEDWSIYNALPD